MQRNNLRKWSLLLGAAAIVALPTPSRAQLTQYDLDTRMGMESHIGNITGHAKDAKGDYRRYCVVYSLRAIPDPQVIEHHRRVFDCFRHRTAVVQRIC